MMRWKKQIRPVGHLLILSSLLVAGLVPSASAAQCATNANQQTCSSNYGVNEAFFGTGGNLHACSATYCSKQAAGETSVGNTKSANYQAQGGFNTDRTPSLTFVVNTGSINFGVLTAGTTATATATFNVKSYLSSGYIVQTVGAGMSNGSRLITNLATPTASSSSSEQFGMNLAANTSPAIAGSAAPAQNPSATFGFGTAATGYSTANQFKYVNGDTIAQSLKSSGETDYTISYILNTTALTPGGAYTMNQALVATATY